MGSRIVRESSEEGGGEADGTELSSSSEQKDPDLDVSAEALRVLREDDMLKYLLS